MRMCVNTWLRAPGVSTMRVALRLDDDAKLYFFSDGCAGKSVKKRDSIVLIAAKARSMALMERSGKPECPNNPCAVNLLWREGGKEGRREGVTYGRRKEGGKV